MIENKVTGENTYPPLSFFFLYSTAITNRTMNKNHAVKRYFDMPCSNILIKGQLKNITPNIKREIQLSLIIEYYFIKG